MSTLGALFLTSISALLFALAFPPMAWKPVAWIALAPFFLALRSVGFWGALLLALVWSTVTGYVTGEWLPRAVSSYFDQTKLVGALFFFFVCYTMLTPYYMAFAPTVRSFVRHCGVFAPLLVAAAWASVELGRGRLFNGTIFYFGSTPWATFGYSQVDIDPLVQIASVTGVYGISFVLVAVNAALAELCAAFRRGREARRRAALGLGLATVPALAAAIFGLAELRSAPPVDATDPSGVEIAIVQGNLGSESRWRSELYGRHLAVYGDLTLGAFVRGLPETVFWPESAMTFFLEREPDYRRFIGRILASGGAELVGGAPRHDAAPTPRFWNSIYLLSADGAIRDRYDKQHLLPFMEYFPVGVDLLRRSFGRIREFTPGDPDPPLPTRAGLAGVLVCNEALLPHFSTWRVAEGATYLLNPTNDSWVADLYYAEHLFDIVALRAVEQRRYLVRASTTGPSAIVDPWGRIQVTTKPFARDVVLGWVRPIEERSVYGRVGDLFGVVCVFATVAALLWGVLRSRRERGGARGRSPESQ